MVTINPNPGFSRVFLKIRNDGTANTSQDFASKKGAFTTGCCEGQKTVAKLYGKTITLQRACDPSILYSLVKDKASEMFHYLEEKRYFNSKKVFQRRSKKEVLETLVDESVKNAVEAAAKRFKDRGYNGAEISILAFTERSNLWIQVLDNGFGFTDEVLETLGKESTSSRHQRNESDFYIEDTESDHLYKMSQLATLLGWDLVVKNRESKFGGNVSIGIPLAKQSFT